MKFKHRLGYYLVGFLVGIMFLLFIFQNKKAEFCYLPNCRILKNIRSKGMVVSPEAQKKLDEKWVTMQDITNSLSDGDVDLSESNKPHKGGKLYIIESENAEGEPIVVEVVNYDNRAVLKDIKKGE